LGLIFKGLKWLGLGLLVLLVVGAIYQQIGAALDAKLAPPADQMVSVNGHAVHLDCVGNGQRTYVLDAGAGAGAFEWWRLLPLLAKTGRVCAFDRPGLGWSESSGGTHDAVASAHELAGLVRAAKIPVPFIYVGHSLGANIGIVYRDLYPHDVAGLVLIEPGNPKDLLEDFHGTRDEAMGQRPDCGFICYTAGAAAYLGIARLSVLIAVPGGKNLSGPALNEYRAILARPSHVMATVSSFIDALPKTAYEDMGVRTFGNTPVVVFASSKRFNGDGFDSQADYDKWRIEQHAYLASLAAMSAHGAGPIAIPDSNHSSMVMGERQSVFLAQEILRFATRSGL
jgi:pimeloyl-ACP methyl ester carboxylesterase